MAGPLAIAEILLESLVQTAYQYYGFGRIERRNRICGRREKRDATQNVANLLTDPIPGERQLMQGCDNTST